MDHTMTPQGACSLELRWVEVTDDAGRHHLEMRWVEPSSTPTSPVVTHATAA